jgi:kynurenine formamidase
VKKPQRKQAIVVSGDGGDAVSKGSDMLAAIALALASGDIVVVDLTQTLSPDFPTLVLPPELGQCAPFRIEEVSRYDGRGPGWYWNNITLCEHTGTHFDAPIHWVSGRDLPNNATDSIPPAHFIAPACVIDLTCEAAADGDALLELHHIHAWEAEYGRIPARSWVLLRTDWSKRDPASYVNLRDDGAHTPGPSSEAIRFLVDERDILGFGNETIGTDAGQAHHFSPPYPAHYFLHGKGRYGLQCLTNLDRLPLSGALVIAAPLKIRQGSGSPLRVLALVPQIAKQRAVE